MIDKAKIKMGSHLGEFKVLNVVSTTQDKLTLTKVEIQMPNFTFYDGFQILSIDGDWQKTGTYQVQDNEVLLKESTLKVTGKFPGNTPPETGVNEFIDSGQINIPENPNELEVLGFEEDGDKKYNGYYYNYDGMFEGRLTGQKNGKDTDVYVCCGKEDENYLNIKKFLQIIHSLLKMLLQHMERALWRLILLMN